MAPRGCSLKEAFKMADDVLLQAVKGVSDLILVPGLINLDFADAQTVMSKKGMALMGTGMASGPDRSTVAAEKAISSPLLDDISVKGAQGLLINIASAEDNIALDEVDEACSRIQQEAHEDATVIFGVAWDNSLGDNIRVTVIATGIGLKKNEERITTLDSADDLDKHIPTLEEIHQDRTGEYDRPTKERQGRVNISPIKQPRYANFEDGFSGVDEDLEKPTFMRRQAD